MAYRDDLAALSARHDALADEVTQKTRELEASRHLLEQARARAKLPVLDNLHVATPCTADWNKMTGDDRTRHCGDCQKTVYNLSGMTREEAEALLSEKTGDLCVRYFQRHDGTILFGDCAIDSKRRRTRLAAAGAATLLAATTATFGVRAWLLAAPPRLEQPRAYPTREYPTPGQPTPPGQLMPRHVTYTMGLVARPIVDPSGSHPEIKDPSAPTAPGTHAPAHGKPGEPGHVP